MLTPRPYQIDGLNAIWSYFSNGGKGNPVIAWPTGTGKSLIPAMFIKEILRHYPNQRFLLATHVKELIQQNADKVNDIWPNAPLGIHSAGLKQRDVVNPIIYGGIQTMYKIPDAFGHRDIVFIDEAHLVNLDETSMYIQFLLKLKAINPFLKIIGMTATPFRMGQGMITDEGGIFTDICHDLTSLENFNQLIKDEYLAPLIPKHTDVELDVTNVGINKGEFNMGQLQHEVDKAEVTWKGLQELVHYGQNRKSWLIFATGIEHAEHIATMLGQIGIDCAAVHSKQKAEYNDAAIKAFKSYELRAIVNYGKLTTGFDHPGIDLIGMFRPTLSVPLWVQMLGRGTRPSKPNCLVLDFARNTQRLGPINDPVIPRKKTDSVGEVPIKICEACGVYNHIKAITCDSCGNPFSFTVKITPKAATQELIRQVEAPQIKVFDVNFVYYNEKQKTGKAPYIKVTYACGAKVFNEFVFPENTRFRKPYFDWWHMRHASPPPDTVKEALQYTAQLRPPKRIRVHTNKMINGKNWPEVLSAEY